MKDAFSMFYTDKTWAFDQSGHVPGPIYMITLNFDDNNLLHNLKGHLLMACRMNDVLVTQ